MFGIAPSELVLVALVALIFIGPRDLPRAMRFAGTWIGRGRAMSRHMRHAVDQLLSEAERMGTKGEIRADESSKDDVNELPAG